jgi:hypothetical protein
MHLTKHGSGVSFFEPHFSAGGRGQVDQRFGCFAAFRGLSRGVESAFFSASSGVIGLSVNPDRSADFGNLPRSI